MSTRTDALRLVRTPAIERPASVDQERIDAFVARVLGERAHLIDAWETTALIESLGYNDGRVQRELGFENTLAVGDYVYLAGRARVPETRPWSAPTDSALTIIARSAASTVIYAVPWLAVFIAQTVEPNAMTLPSRVAPALALALMFSLIVSGGFVQAIVRRGEFYVGVKQFGLAKEMVDGLLRLGIASTIVAAAIGVIVARYFELAEWSSLILGVDAFVVMSVLWMVCAAFTIRRQQWRVTLSFIAAFVAFGVARTVGADALTSQLIAALVLLAAATVQQRGLFADGAGLAARSAKVALPRLSVLVYWTVPYFWYGVAYFSFLFADRLTAGTARATFAGASFGIPVPYVMGMELALLTLLVAASGVEVAGALFARALVREAARAFAGDTTATCKALRRHYRRAIGLVLATFLVVACGVAAAASRMLPDLFSSEAWAVLLAGDVGYACLAVGFVNALVLFQTRQPWAAVRALTVALAINLAGGYIVSHMFDSFHAVAGLLMGAAYFAMVSTLDVRRTLKRPDYAYALG